MQRLTHNLKPNNSRVKILSSEEHDLGDLLRGGSLLISDYSSVVWDFAVQRKPVIFYQFDKETYLEKVGSLVDLDTLPIGESFTDVKQVIQSIEFFAKRGMTITEQTKKNIQSIFGKVRSDYSKQIYEYIKEEFTNAVWSNKS
jgi:CDP-glycerol glycerophosphotransferase (TagB/SpsB family)